VKCWTESRGKVKQLETGGKRHRLPVVYTRPVYTDTDSSSCYRSEKWQAIFTDTSVDPTVRLLLIHLLLV